MLKPQQRRADASEYQPTNKNKNGLRPTQERGKKMKKIYAIKLVNGKPTTMHEFESKEALISFASTKIYEEATNTLTINELINLS